MRRRPRGARRLSVRRADRPHCGTAPVRELLVVEALGHVRVPLAGDGPDPRAGVEPAAIDAHRAAEAAADLERRLDDGVAGRGGTGSKYVTLRDGLRRAIPFLLARSGRCARASILYGQGRSRL